MAWNKLYPLAATVISASVGQIQDNWSAIESTTSSEHAILSAATSGTHLYGRVSAMFSGTYSAITSLSSPATGALAYDTECGVCRIYNGSSWVVATSQYFSRVHMYTNSTQAISTVTWTQVTLGTEGYDSLSEGSSSSITVVAAGWYLVVGSITWQSEALNNYQKVAGLYVDGTRKSVDAKYGRHDIVTEVVDVLNLSAGQVVTLRAYHSYASNVNTTAANLILTRLS